MQLVTRNPVTDGRQTIPTPAAFLWGGLPPPPAPGPFLAGHPPFPLHLYNPGDPTPGFTVLQTVHIQQGDDLTSNRREASSFPQAE